jgi:hypothetical protein
VAANYIYPERIITMKRSLISLLVAGLFAGTATAVLAADTIKSDPNAVKSETNAADTSQSRAADPNKSEAMNDGKDARNDTKQSGYDSKAEADFKRADKDNDGTLDRKEARHLSNKHVAKNFDAIDADKDGTISWDELNTYMAANPAHKKGNM